MIYRMHGIAHIDYDSLFHTLDNLDPLYRSEWGVDYWNNNRDDKEMQIKKN